MLETVLASEERVLALTDEALEVKLSVLVESSTLEDVLAAVDILVLEYSIEYEVLATEENEALEACELAVELRTTELLDRLSVTVIEDVEYVET